VYEQCGTLSAMTHPPSLFEQLTIAHWISIAQVVATALVGVIAGVITWVMQSRQIDVAKGLKDIARGQHETAATKLRLELFEKRFKAYEEVLTCMDIVSEYDGGKNHHYSQELNRRFIKSYAPIKYLFNESIYEYLKREVNERMRRYVNDMNSSFSLRAGYIEETTASIDHSYYDLQMAYLDLAEMVSPFLQVEKENPLIEQDDQS
jgi:hypothetical protein